MEKPVTVKQAPVAKSVRIASIAEGIVMRFQTATGEIYVGLNYGNLSRLAMAILEQAAKTPLSGMSDNRDKLKSPGTLGPIQSSAISVGSGRTEEEVTLVVKIGTLELGFWTEKAVIDQLYRDVRSVPRLPKAQLPN